MVDPIIDKIAPVEELARPFFEDLSFLLLLFQE